LTIRSDQILFGNLLFGMMEIAKRIRPTYKGKISIFIEQIDEHVEIEVTLLEDAEYPFRLSDDNPEIFMAHSLAKKLKGRFRIEQQNSSWKIIALLPIENE